MIQFHFGNSPGISASEVVMCKPVELPNKFITILALKALLLPSQGLITGLSGALLAILEVMTLSL